MMSGRGEGAGTPQFDTALAQFIVALRSRGMTDRRVLNAFEQTPRTIFLPHLPAAVMYEPVSLPLPCGQEAPDAFTLARMLRALDPEPTHVALEIGTGSGFFTGLLARTMRRVTTIERFFSLHERAAAALPKAGIRNVILQHGDGLAVPEDAQLYDRIVLTGAVAVVPPALFARLSPGGMLIAPILDETGAARVQRFTEAGAEGLVPPLPCRVPALQAGVARAL